MVAWMNREALAATLATGRATFFSRSRQELWKKGETSGNHLVVREILADCDEDVLLLRVEPAGPSCHTGQPSCFFRRVDERGQTRDETTTSGPLLLALERVIAARGASTAERSYTRSLLDGGAPKLAAKLSEEAEELGRAVTEETAERVASEAADLLFHLLVALRSREVPLRAVLAELDRRSGVSGHVEKASRG